MGADGRSRRAARDGHWSSLFGEVAVHSFLVLLLTGAFLTFFYDPGMERVDYDGSYVPLRGVPVSAAYSSTLDIGFDVRGGLLMRQIHHWAALVFVAAVCCRLLGKFLTGTFRRPGVRNWLIWVAMLPLGMVAGVTGGLLPDDMLSGGSLGLIQGITQSVPVIGTRLTFLVFGSDVPGDDVIPRAYWLHITVLPLLMAVLFAALRRPSRPSRATGAALGLYTFGVLALLGTLFQINPVWKYGPFRPGAITAGAVPDWYMGFLDGAVRIMPGWEPEIAGRPLTLAVLVPALLVPGGFFTVLAAWPWLERRFTGDDRIHLLPDRPREAVLRTAFGAAGVAFYGLLWAASANDQIAVRFHLSLYAVTWFFRIAVFAGPVLAFLATRAICSGLTQRERHEARHGRETGRIVMNRDGGFTETLESRTSAPGLCDAFPHERLGRP
ncbi:cytochrome b [Actinocorallia longicatena]